MRARSEGGYPSGDSSSEINLTDFDQIDSIFSSAEQQLKLVPLLFGNIPEKLLTMPKFRNEKLGNKFKNGRIAYCEDFIDGELEHRDIQLKQDIRILQEQIVDVLSSSKEVQQLNQKIQIKQQQMCRFIEKLDQHIKQMRQINEKLILKQQEEDRKPLRNPEKAHETTKLKIKQELLTKRNALEDKNRALEEERDNLRNLKNDLKKKIDEIQAKTEQQTKAKKRNWLKQQFIAEKIACKEFQNYIQKYEKALNISQ